VRLHGAEGTPLQAWADAALIPTPSIDVTVYPTACGNHLACASQAGIWIAWTDPNLPARKTLLHEIGHHVDYGMPWQYRELFQRMTGTVGRPWRDAPNSPHEQFAEAYALCAVGGRSRSLGLWLPRRGNYRRSLCALVGAAALTQPEWR
jgi:hypothetical protein